MDHPNGAARAPATPGYYRNIPIADYHAGPGVSKSQLDLVDKAPALLEWSRNAPRDEEASAAVDTGQALHTLVLEPERFALEYAEDFKAPANAISRVDEMKDALDYRGIAYTSKDTLPVLERKLLEFDPEAPVLSRLRKAWADELGTRTVLTATEARKLRLMRESILAHPFARALIEAPGDVEASTYWIDPETGVLCRKRDDKLVLLGDRRIPIDLKITADIGEFWRAVDDYRYDVQDAWYREGHEQHHGARPDGFLFVAVSSQRDAGRYPVRVIGLPPELLERGRARARANLNTYARCKASGQWPGVETLTRPAWAR